VLAAYLPTGGGAFALILERLGVAALTVSAYLANFPQRLYGGDEDEPRGSSGYESIDEMRAARRAAREAAQRTYMPPPPPLLQDSLSGRGGVQGLNWHDLALCRDADGDEAHDFWEAVLGGAFRRCAK